MAIGSRRRWCRLGRGLIEIAFAKVVGNLKEAEGSRLLRGTISRAGPGSRLTRMNRRGGSDGERGASRSVPVGIESLARRADIGADDPLGNARRVTAVRSCSPGGGQ